MPRLYDVFIKSYCINEETDAEFLDIVRDVYDSEEFKGLKKFCQHGNINRYDHVMSVTYVAYYEAVRLGADVRSTVRGAIMHDLFYSDWHDSSWAHRPNGYRHPGFALKNARILTGYTLSESEEDAIIHHMWPLTPTPPHSQAGWIVTFADKYCATREMMIATLKKYELDFILKTGKK